MYGLIGVPAHQGSAAHNTEARRRSEQRLRELEARALRRSAQCPQARPHFARRPYRPPRRSPVAALPPTFPPAPRPKPKKG
ncbi:unnamed protein product [Urochloa humidicola]